MLGDECSTEELRHLNDVANWNASRRGRARLAVIAGSELQFRLSLIFAMRNDLNYLAFLVLRDIVKAKRWLLRENERGDGDLK